MATGRRTLNIYFSQFCGRLQPLRMTSEMKSLSLCNHALSELAGLNREIVGDGYKVEIPRVKFLGCGNRDSLYCGLRYLEFSTGFLAVVLHNRAEFSPAIIWKSYTSIAWHWVAILRDRVLKIFVTVAVVHVDTTSPRKNQIMTELQKRLKGVRLSCSLASRYKHNAIEH